MLARTVTSIYRTQLELNARCIDFVHGGLYAWTYLSIAGFTDDEILKVLDAPPQSWCYQAGNAEARARAALDAVGIAPGKEGMQRVRRHIIGMTK